MTHNMKKMFITTFLKIYPYISSLCNILLFFSMWLYSNLNSIVHCEGMHIFPLDMKIEPVEPEERSWYDSLIHNAFKGVLFFDFEYPTKDITDTSSSSSSEGEIDGNQTCEAPRLTPPTEEAPPLTEEPHRLTPLTEEEIAYKCTNSFNEYLDIR